MKQFAIGVGIGLLALALSACGSSSSSSSAAPANCPIPAYTLVAANPSTYVATVNADCSVTTSGGGHIHMLFTQPASGATTTMTVNARFDANLGQIYLLFYGTTLAADGTGGWIVQHDFVSSTLHLSICNIDTTTCTGGTQAAANYSNSYSLGTFYPLTVQVTKNALGDTYKAWADTAFSAASLGDKYGTLVQTTTGTLLGIHIIDATVKSVTIQ